MKTQSLACAACLLCGLLAACKESPAPLTSTVSGSDTAVLGNAAQHSPAAQAIPPPPLPADVRAQLVPSGPGTAVALWVQGGEIMASTYASDRGWAPAQALEQIYGDASEPQLASDGKGYAIAVWHHTVGKIHSLRFSRYEAGTGWSVPDVMPGALPRPAGQAGALQLRMDASGQAFASWPSGFDENEVQSSRFIAGQGWSRAVSEPTAAAVRGSAPNGG
ncbi:hypothetical protein FN976_07790 [Caenimonas sedimenti]|uniref:Exo-alpha-sialidase n=1 Tax=Caenimonas sedimenti TaxID=2596921 RepID=A0A562ZUA6_9BURK|nr:hypothetical protein [Caenimonas sedimenti]TWO71885.1 hypothetical protein FN976_07790 [Caenimonas sedimenti]